MGTAVLYPMALLRVADYLRLISNELLRSYSNSISLKAQSQCRSGKNTGPCSRIGPANDPRGKMVSVSTDLSLSLYLQLRDLLSGLQSEMDHSTAVLDEAYGTMTELGLHQLNLVTRRVYSNLQSPQFAIAFPMFQIKLDSQQIRTCSRFLSNPYTESIRVLEFVN